MDEIILNTKQQEVLDYIRKYSGPEDLTENKIVNAFKKGETDTKRGNYARMTVLSIIDYLEKYNFIKIDKINTQFHVIKPNYNHLFNKLENELDEFEEKYLILTERLKNIVVVNSNQNINYMQRRDKNVEQLSHYLILLFQHLFGIYVMNVLVIWQQQTKNKDEKLLGKLIMTAFQRLQKILLSNKVFISISPSEKIAIDPIPTLGLNLFVLDKTTIEYMLKLCKEIDIQSETEKVLDSLWNISKYYFPYAKIKFEEGPQSQPEGGFKPYKRIPDNWRDVIDYNNKSI
jgi:hypothetical protein